LKKFKTEVTNEISENFGQDKAAVKKMIEAQERQIAMLAYF